MSDDPELITSLDGFLASVEKRAFIMARTSTGNEDAALDIVQDSMFRMVKSYSKRPCEQWPPLFFRIVNNRITDHHRRRGFDRLVRWFGSARDEEGVTQDAVDRLPAETGSPDEQVQMTPLSGDWPARGARHWRRRLPGAGSVFLVRPGQLPLQGWQRCW